MKESQEGALSVVGVCSGLTVGILLERVNALMLKMRHLYMCGTHFLKSSHICDKLFNLIGFHSDLEGKLRPQFFF